MDKTCIFLPVLLLFYYYLKNKNYLSLHFLTTSGMGSRLVEITMSYCPLIFVSFYFIRAIRVIKDAEAQDAVDGIPFPLTQALLQSKCFSYDFVFHLIHFSEIQNGHLVFSYLHLFSNRRIFLHHAKNKKNSTHSFCVCTQEYTTF